ncbi:hypothetical protein C8R43DRAFT_1210965 [Mycena crocata]|nr:hypothetical protein C8R43DRAFT_1210965 [Mycena crocata]
MWPDSDTAFPRLVFTTSQPRTSPAQALETVSLVGQNKTAVVIGGTLGIGAAIARLLAKLGCSRIIICGRNATRAAAVIELLKKFAPAESKIKAEFVKADLSDSKGMRDAASALQATAGDAAIDCLIMTQNGVPTGSVEDNADGYDIPFAIQAVFRFALAYLLTTRGGLAPNAAILSVCNQDQSLDDLSITFGIGPGVTITVLDAFHEELNLWYPQYRYYHLYPGLVQTEEFDVTLFSAILWVPFWVAMKLIGTTPDQYAALPVYVIVAPDTERELDHPAYLEIQLGNGHLEDSEGVGAMRMRVLYVANLALKFSLLLDAVGLNPPCHLVSSSESKRSS